MKDSNNYKVYMIENKINHKKYIGITQQKLQDRWKNGNGYRHTSHLYAAIQKYGWDNFNHILLYDNLSKEEACQKEIYLIKFYQTQNREYGYNNSSGGEINTGFHHSEISKKKMSIAAKNRSIDWNKIQKMKEVNSKRIRCVETGEIFSSIAEAKKQKNIKGNHIGECCQGIRKTCDGYHWEYVTI